MQGFGAFVEAECCIFSKLGCYCWLRAKKSSGKGEGAVQGLAPLFEPSAVYSQSLVLSAGLGRKKSSSKGEGAVQGFGPFAWGELCILKAWAFLLAQITKIFLEPKPWNSETAEL